MGSSATSFVKNLRDDGHIVAGVADTGANTSLLVSQTGAVQAQLADGTQIAFDPNQKLKLDIPAGGLQVKINNTADMYTKVQGMIDTSIKNGNFGKSYKINNITFNQDIKLSTKDITGAYGVADVGKLIYVPDGAGYALTWPVAVKGSISFSTTTDNKSINANVGGLYPGETGLPKFQFQPTLMATEGGKSRVTFKLYGTDDKIPLWFRVIDNATQMVVFSTQIYASKPAIHPDINNGWTNLPTLSFDFPLDGYGQQRQTYFEFEVPVGFGMTLREPAVYTLKLDVPPGGVKGDNWTVDENAYSRLFVNGKAFTWTKFMADVTGTKNIQGAFNIGLTADDVGAVPQTRKINGKTMTSDVTLSAADVGAISQTDGDARYALSNWVTSTFATGSWAMNRFVDKTVTINGKSLNVNPGTNIQLTPADIGITVDPMSMFPTGTILPVCPSQKDSNGKWIINMPEGWYLADGGQVYAPGKPWHMRYTPDLRNRFLVGANAINDPNVTTFGGAKSVKLTQYNLPNIALSGGTSSDSAGRPSGTVAVDNSTNNPSSYYLYATDYQGNPNGARDSSSEGYPRAYWRGVNGSWNGLSGYVHNHVARFSGDQLGNHNHSVNVNLNPTGRVDEVPTMPPYYVIMYMVKMS